MRRIEIKFEEKGKIFFDSAIIGKDITEEQAQGLVDLGIGIIIEEEEKEKEVK
jgi:hypothetical protein